MATGKSSPKRPPRGVNRQRLIDTARDLFATHGYNGVSVREVVGEAGLSQRMVYHYFGSKEELYRAVLEDVFSRLEALELDTLTTPQSPDRMIEAVLQVYFQFLKDNPAFVRLLLWENLQPVEPLESTFPGGVKRHMLSLLRDTIAQGEQASQLRTGLEPAHLLVQIIGLSLIYFSNRHTLSASLGLDFTDDKVLQTGVEHAAGILRSGITHPLSPQAATDPDGRLAVYGTLRTGSNLPLAVRLRELAHFQGHGSFPGGLYKICDDFPGATFCETAQTRVPVDIYRIPGNVNLFEDLDRYEGCHFSQPPPHLFARRSVPVRLEDGTHLVCWVYLYQGPIRGRPLINKEGHRPSKKD